MTSAADPRPPSPRAIEALLAFWAEAGVSVSASAEPIDRLAAPSPHAARAQPAPAAAPARPTAPAPAKTQPPPSQAADARSAADGAADLTALANAIAAFEGCALRHSGATRPVILRGDPATADLLVIGDAPSAEDEAAGAPFQGAQGRLLDAMLTAAGLADRVLLINTVFWRTPGGAAPTGADQAACRPFLERAAALLKPRAVLLVGAAAARGVLRTDEPILKLRGRWMEWTGDGAALTLPTLATFSPSFLLAQPLAKKRAWGDLLTLAARLDPAGPAP